MQNLVAPSPSPSPCSQSVPSIQGVSQRPPPPRSSPDFLYFLLKLQCSVVSLCQEWQEMWVLSSTLPSFILDLSFYSFILPLICPSICLSHLPIYLPTHPVMLPSIHLPTHQPIYASISISSTCPSVIHPPSSIHPSIHPCILPSIHPSIHVSFHPSIHSALRPLPIGQSLSSRTEK